MRMIFPYWQTIMTTFSETEQALAAQISKLAPWHHDIQITDKLSSGLVFSPERTLHPKDNQGVSLISPNQRFNRIVDRIYPESMKGVRFLDCACNAGAYCFLARQRNADMAVGFDVREHWIKQGNFVLENCTAQPVDRIKLSVADLYDLPKQETDPFDFTYFSGIFYHLPDPITGLKIAADLTQDVLLLNTACMLPGKNPLGMTIAMESKDAVMSGVYELAWLPNSPEALWRILQWLGFVEAKMTVDNISASSGRRRVELLAARTKGRLENVRGDAL